MSVCVSVCADSPTGKHQPHGQGYCQAAERARRAVTLFLLSTSSFLAELIRFGMDVGVN